MTRQRGFSLLELLVALTLLAAVGGTLLQLFHNGLRSARLADAQAHAVLLARSKLTELQTYRHLQPGTLSGQFDRQYRWQAELTEDSGVDETTAGPLKPLDLVLTISWGETGEARSFSLHSLLLSQWSES